MTSTTLVPSSPAKGTAALDIPKQRSVLNRALRVPLILVTKGLWPVAKAALIVGTIPLHFPVAMGVAMTVKKGAHEAHYWECFKYPFIKIWEATDV